MNRADALRRLHVVRSLGGHISAKYGVAIALVHKQASDPLPLVDAPASSLAGGLKSALETSPEAATVHRSALLRALEAGDGALVEHPFGFGMLIVSCTVGRRAGRLVAYPVSTRGGESERITSQLIEQGVTARDAETLAASMRPIDRGALVNTTELLRLIAGEVARFTYQWHAAERRLDHLRKQHRTRYTRLVGQSLPMLQLFSLLDRIVQTDSTVYVNGENGTGKELVAREIHDHSLRAELPFVVQNCSALNDNLLESELFGHKRGAFTGAIQDKRGLFELADNGTFFLDEVGDMSAALQVKLLRVLQEGTFSPVGDTAVRKVDVRVICATNRNLKKMVQDGTFREDLYYRINVISLVIPPLRERRDDIPLLVDYFLTRALQAVGNPGGQKRLSRDAMQLLNEYEWPGNVRELENEIERLVVFTGPLVSTIGSELLSPRIRTRALAMPTADNTTGMTLPQALERVERAMIQEELRKNRWNKTRAAEGLGISRRNLIRKVAKYGFERRTRDRSDAS